MLGSTSQYKNLATLIEMKPKRTKWWKLEGDALKVFKEKVIEEDPWNDEGDANSMWEMMTTCVRKVASKVLGVTKGSGCDSKDTW